MTWTIDSAPRLNGKLAVVTGANSGIGFETARELARLGATVIMACRSIAKADAARDLIMQQCPDSEVIVRQLDLSSQASVHAFAKSLSTDHSKLDILINNAGIMFTPFERTEDGFEQQFATNYLGHFALTGLLLPLLEQSPAARVVSLSSLAHRVGRINFTNLNSEQRYSKVSAYTQSKLACLMFAYELDRRLKKSASNVISLGAHPGVTKTELVSHTRFTKHLLVFAQSTFDGALPMLRAALDDTVVGGEYFGPKNLWGCRGMPVLETPFKRAQDQQVASRLWSASQRLTNLQYASLDEV